MEGYCIYCSVKLDEINIHFPYCSLCGGKCSSTNRASSSDKSPIYCHVCGEPAYISEDNPVCDECKNK